MATPGLELVLEGPLAGDPIAVNTYAATEVEQDLFGIDLLFTDDLQATSSGDYTLVSGMAALKQAIRIILITTPGEYAVNPSFGCGLKAFCKKRATKSDRDSLRQTIIEQLTLEPRIQKVSDVVVESLTSGNLPGVKVTVKIMALGREQSFSLQQFSD